MKVVRKGLSVINVENLQKGTLLAKSILSKIVDKKTVLFLSGGSTPKPLYELIAKKGGLSFGAVVMVDERFGGKMHKNSNEKMIRETGLLLYLEEKKIPFYPILQLHPKGVASYLAGDYNKKVKYLLRLFSKKIAIMGIGEDGHTASLPAGTPHNARSSRDKQNSSIGQAQDKTQNYVTAIDNFPGECKKRITLTFKALSEMDLLIALAFGSAKESALVSMFEKGSLEEIPARFYTKSEIAKKTILITDQKI